MRKEIEDICKEYSLIPEFTKDDKLTEESKKEFVDKIVWKSLSQILSESFIREFQDKVNWDYISIHQDLSEGFIREFKNKVNWVCISVYQKLSEGFIREFADKVCWVWISVHQELSEEFIREFEDKIYWGGISISQKLSEEFIREFKDKLYWYWISRYQKLSKGFIREFQDKVNWDYISEYQKLSEEFIREFQDKVNWHSIFNHQKLSKKFRREFSRNGGPSNYCWLYKSVKFKLKYIKENTNYKVVDNKYIIAYKSVRKNMRSVYSPGMYKYEIGKEYTSRCNCNIHEGPSYGLSAARTKKGALNYYCTGKLLKVKIAIKDIGVITSYNCIRCRKLKVLKVVKK